MNKFKFLISACAFVFQLLFVEIGSAQTASSPVVEAGKFDMGKMWTFDYPPLEYFKQEYQFSPDEKWFENARLSALRFANYCSASFVSENGLVMTNHHCARDAGFSVQRKDENFKDNGFYATKLEQERQVPGLYVDQLIKIQDITDRVQASITGAGSESKVQIAARDSVFKAIVEDYKTKDGWKDLEIQTVSFYSGGKYTLYGFKRYKDVRLVFMPELSLGSFGGDFDNFTYPRYDLDCSFFRVYDEQGKPLKTDHYFKFAKQPVQENEPVFVIGNPGSTGRLWTISDLMFRRDSYLPLWLNYLEHRADVLRKFNSVAKSDSLINVILRVENSIKALSGEFNGLNDPYLIERKKAFEKKFRDDASKKPSLACYMTIWDEIDNSNAQLSKLNTENFLFSGSSNLVGNTLALAILSAQYNILLKTEPNRAKNLVKLLQRAKNNTYPVLEEQYLMSYLTELKKWLKESDPIRSIFNGKTAEQLAGELLKSTSLNDKSIWNKLNNADTSAFKQLNDPLVQLATQIAERYLTVSAKYKATDEILSATRSKLGRVLFELYGTQIPPDATFSLRIADGIVKGYKYNGTIAPPKTTYFGLYDRFYSFNKQYPWALPERWQNPPKELLSIPTNFVSTNDIIGGNSGSPIINKNLEVVGLVFDGNIESLSGRFIYVPDANRTISVDATGILGALKYIYKAKRLEKELSGN